MTKDTPPRVQIDWVPRPEGIALQMNDKRFKLPMVDVRVLWHYMEEANMLARGFQKHEIEFGEIEPLDVMIVGGDALTVSSTFIESLDGEELYGASFGDAKTDITKPSSALVNVYRRIE